MPDFTEARAALASARAALDRNKHDPGLALEYIRARPEIKASELTDLVEVLVRGEYGCHRNDIIGVFELLEEWLDKQEQIPQRGG